MNKYKNKFLQSKVLVLGDIFLDRYWKCESSRISREAPVVILKHNNTHDVPGGAANVAMNIASLNVPVTMVGFIGTDEEGKSVLSLFDKYNINHNLVFLQDFPTITKLRIISQQQQLIRVDFEHSYKNSIDYSLILDILKKEIPKHNAIILSDYNLGTLQHIDEIIKIAKNYNIPVLIDPKGDDFSIYNGATIITPNMQEFEIIVGKCNNESEIIERGFSLLNKMELEYILLTRSEKGMILFKKDGTVFNLATDAKEVFDVTGAGDTVIALMGVSVAEGLDIEEACFLANKAAGLVVSKMGTSTISIDELNSSIYVNKMIDNILSEEELIEKVKKARLNNEKIVMTNGCFDILHTGHISYLESARQLGHKLIVAVNDDNSVKLLKGDSRPYNCLKDRMEMLAALKSVDWVVSFSEETPDRLISRILPDVLVKGGDYKLEDIVGYKHVLNNGGEVFSLCFVESKSTTNLIKKIKNSKEY